jgi:glycolate oxidase
VGTEGYKKIQGEDITFFADLLGKENLISSGKDLSVFGSDETEDLCFPPELVLFPETAEQIAKIMAYCNREAIPVTPRGAGTGLSGGALPVFGGVVLSIKRLNRILDIDLRNLQVTVEPGVITQVLQDAVAEKGLYYPPDPASRGSCFIGGNVAENSGGPHALKYGVTKDYVLNLEVVLPDGTLIWTGANVLKNSTGFNLTQLFVGSEGTLGIITKIVLRLIPQPGPNVVMLVPFRSAEKACEAVSAVFRKGITPSALEFMERDAIDFTLKFVDDVNLPVDPDVRAHLLVEIEGKTPEAIFEEADEVRKVMEAFEAGEILFADTDEQKASLWKLRRRVGEAVKSHSVYKEEDTVVPRAELPALLKGVKEIGSKYGFQSVCYGHAGDGNLHVNILKGNLSDEVWERDIPLAIRQIFKLCVSLGGTLSGEHGIGWVQKGFMDIAFSERMIDLQKEIKKVFDPKGILNPGKLFE